MALNSDQLIQSFLVLRYPISPECTCNIEKRTIRALRNTKEVKIREQMKGWPEETKKEVLNQMIEKEKENA